MNPCVTPETIMNAYAEATGVTDVSHPQRRYLWTDAFAVCNFLELYRQTERPACLELATRLVDRVHCTLGKSRDGKSWLSGLNEEQALLHPTLGGLRIGKKFDERQVDEPANDNLEWDRDGQYFHYLTRWMHALDRLGRVTANPVYNKWAIELAKVSYAAFTYTPPGAGIKRMFWKMSIDLGRPQIDSMGQHDPLDGLITFLQLQATAKYFSEASEDYSLETEIQSLQEMCSGGQWGTQDSLGIGGLLADAYNLVQLISIGEQQHNDRLERLLQDAELSLQAFLYHHTLNLTAERRLAFRELGLAIGLSAIEKMQATVAGHSANFTHAERLNSTLGELLRYLPLIENIRDFWLQEDHRQVVTWTEHADINNVMLATCLAPGGYLSII